MPKWSAWAFNINFNELRYRIHKPSSDKGEVFVEQKSLLKNTRYKKLYDNGRAFILSPFGKYVLKRVLFKNMEEIPAHKSRVKPASKPASIERVTLPHEKRAFKHALFCRLVINRNNLCPFRNSLILPSAGGNTRHP